MLKKVEWTLAAGGAKPVAMVSAAVFACCATLCTACDATVPFKLQAQHSASEPMQGVGAVQARGQTLHCPHFLTCFARPVPCLQREKECKRDGGIGLARQGCLVCAPNSRPNSHSHALLLSFHCFAHPPTHSPTHLGTPIHPHPQPGPHCPTWCHVVVPVGCGVH